MKLTDPKEHLKQVLAKAKAAKDLAAGITPPAPAAAAPVKPVSPAAPVIPTAPKPVAPPVVAAPPPPKPAAPAAPVIPTIPKPAAPPPPVVAAPAPIPVPVMPVTPEPIPEPVEPAAVIVEEPVIPVEEPVAVAPQPFVLPEEPLGQIPIYTPDQPLPESALDGYVFDDLPAEGQEVLEAIAQVNVDNIEQESQVLEAMETIAPMTHAHSDELLEETEAPPSMVTAPHSAPDGPPPSGVKHGFF